MNIKFYWINLKKGLQLKTASKLNYKFINEHGVWVDSVYDIS